jgi:hypothetical protein
MSCEKVAPKNAAQTIFCQNEIITLTKEKMAKKMWAIFVIFKQLVKVNCHPDGRKFAQSCHPAIKLQVPHGVADRIPPGKFFRKKTSQCWCVN